MRKLNGLIEQVFKEHGTVQTKQSIFEHAKQIALTNDMYKEVANNVTYSYISSTMNWMMAQGQMTKVSRGLYRLLKSEPVDLNNKLLHDLKNFMDNDANDCTRAEIIEHIQDTLKQLNI